MKFQGELKFPEVDHPGVPVVFAIDGHQAELVVDGESLGRWSLYDIHARRLIASAFQIDLDGTEITFVAKDPIDFAYRGVQQMAESWATMKSKRIATRSLAIRKSRRGTTPSRIDDLRAAMESNLETVESRRIAGEPTRLREPDFAAPPDPERVVPQPSDVKTPSDVPEPSDVPKPSDVPEPRPAVVESPTEIFSASSGDDIATEQQQLDEERRQIAEERSRLDVERRAAEEREANLVEAYRLEMQRLEAERAEMRREALAETAPEDDRVRDIVDTESGSWDDLEEASRPAEAVFADGEEWPGSLEPDGDPSFPEPGSEFEEPHSVAAPVDEEAEQRSAVAPEPEAQPESEPELEPERVASRDLGPDPDPDLEQVPVEAVFRPEPDPEPEPEPAVPTGRWVDLDRYADRTVDFDLMPEPEPALAGAAGDKRGIMGAVKAAFRSGPKDHAHQFIEAPGGIGITRYVCEECGYVSISSGG